MLAAVVEMQSRFEMAAFRDRSELERRRMAWMDRFARGAPEFTDDKSEHTDRLENRTSQKRTTK